MVREHSNENQIWCVNIGEYMFFWGLSWILMTVAPRSSVSAQQYEQGRASPASYIRLLAL